MSWPSRRSGPRRHAGRSWEARRSDLALLWIGHQSAPPAPPWSRGEGGGRMRRASRAGGLRGEAGIVVRCIDSNTLPFLRHPSLGLTFATACTPASVREATTGFVNPPLPNTRARPSPSAACADSDPGWACHPQNASPRYCTQHKYLLHIGGRGAPTARLGRARSPGESSRGLARSEREPQVTRCGAAGKTGTGTGFMCVSHLPVFKRVHQRPTDFQV